MERIMPGRGNTLVKINIIMIGTYWFRSLALSALLILAMLHGPFALYSLGFPPLKPPGDGSMIIILGLLIYVIASFSVFGLFIPVIRKSVIPEKKLLINFTAPLVIVLGYIAWVTVMLYSLSQSTDL
jgi:hypothetical protein